MQLITIPIVKMIDSVSIDLILKTPEAGTNTPLHKSQLHTCASGGLYFQEQIKRKDSKIVIIKIARKLLNRIRYVLLNQKPYEFGIVK